MNFLHFLLRLSCFIIFYNNNNCNDNGASWLVIVYKIKIIRRDKKIEVEGEGGGSRDAPLPNIIPKKSPSPLLRLVPPLPDPPPLNPG